MTSTNNNSFGYIPATDTGLQALSDEELVHLSQEGMQSATIILCRRYIPLIKRYSKVPQLHSIHDDLESILWEIFLKSIRKYNPYQGVPFAAFAKAKIHYGEMNIYRAQNKQWQREGSYILDSDDGPINILDTMASDDDTETDALRPIEDEVLERAMKELPDLYRHLLHRIFFKGESIASIAESYHMSRQAMSKHYRHALKALRVLVERTL